VPGSRRGDSNP